MDTRFGGAPPAFARAVDQLFEPLRLVSSYGLFAAMTTERNEIVIEGSHDGVEWREYAFLYKPGDVTRRPPWNIPHQPRLDWQMWFAALGTYPVFRSCNRFSTSLSDFLRLSSSSSWPLFGKVA
jgi:hypothetical protein